MSSQLRPIRHATLTDVPAIVALVESAYRGDASRVGWTTEADLLDGQRTDAEDVRVSIERPQSIVLLIDSEPSDGNASRLLGCAHLTVEDGAAWFGMFAVAPDLQGGGVGKRLLAEAERIARDDWQLPTMRMSVIDVRAELVAFYVRRGYSRTGKTKPFPYGQERFGKPRRDDLRFEILEKSLVG